MPDRDALRLGEEREVLDDLGRLLVRRRQRELHHFPDGREVKLKGSLIGLDSKNVTTDKSGRLIAKKGHKTDRLTYVGYGAGAGLLIGVITNQKGVLKDTAIGAGLGYLFGALQKDHSKKVSDVALKSGTEMGVRLDRPMSYPRVASLPRDSKK